jgi:hypothetical protein
MITATGKMYYLVKFKKGRRSLGIREWWLHLPFPNQ